MHPDALLAGLRAELDELKRSGESDPDREKQIKAEMDRVDDLPRPKSTAEEPETVVDRRLAYLEGLRDERDECGEDRRAEIEKEIKRVEKELKGSDVDVPSEDEVEERKQARAGLRVERAVNQPGGRQAPATASKDAAKE